MPLEQPHEWEQIDQGLAYCLTCPAIWNGEIEYMSANPREIEHKPSPQPKSQVSVNIPSRSKEQEIENLKRLLASISQRLDALKTR